MSKLGAELLKMSFPHLEDEAEQDFGEATWDNAVDVVIAYVGHGYDLKRRNKVKVGLETLRTTAACGPCVRTDPAARPVLQ